MRALQRFIGTWLTRGATLGRSGEPEDEFTFVDRYEWLPGGHFIAHTVTGEIGGAALQGHEVIGYDGATLRATSYDSSGTVTHYRCRMKGRGWTAAGERERFAGAFTADARRIDGAWERLVRGTWRPALRVTLTRVGD